MNYYDVETKQLKAVLKLEKIASALQIVAPIIFIVVVNSLFNGSFTWIIFLLPLFVQFSMTVPLAGADKKYFKTSLYKLTEESLSGEDLNLNFHTLLSVEALNTPVDFGIMGNMIFKRYYPERLIIAATSFDGTRTEVDVTLLKQGDRLHLLEQLEYQVNLNRETTNERS